MAGGGIAALKALINFLGKGRGKKGSELLKEVNPKKYGTVLENLMLPDDKKMVGGFRVEYLESLLDTIKNDKAMLDRIKEMPANQQESFFNMINQGANQGRLDVYKKINPDEAILEIEQMIKNLKTKDMSPEEIKRSLNALGGRVGFEKGGSSSDKKKTTPALDKPTISIDPNAPTDPAKRDTLKGAGILGAGVVAGKLGLLEFGPKAIKTVKKVTSDLKEQGMPDFFYEIVEAVKLFGKKEKYKTGILKEDDVYTYRNPKTKELITVEEGPREVRIEFSSDTGNPSTIGVRKGIPDKSTKGKTPPDEYFEQSQIRYPEYGGGDYKDIVDEVAGGYEDLPRIVEDIIDID